MTAEQGVPVGTPADHAATVREALTIANDLGRLTPEAHRALDALLAQAETGEDWKLRGDEAEHSLHHCRGLLDTAEAERDRMAAIGRDWAELRAERDAAVQAAEHAEQALREIVALDANQDSMHIARAALTEDTT